MQKVCKKCAINMQKMQKKLQKICTICKTLRPAVQNMQKICKKYAVYVGSIFFIYMQNMHSDFADDGCRRGRGWPCCWPSLSLWAGRCGHCFCAASPLQCAGPWACSGLGRCTPGGRLQLSYTARALLVLSYGALSPAQAALRLVTSTCPLTGFIWKPIPVHKPPILCHIPWIWHGYYNIRYIF